MPLWQRSGPCLWSTPSILLSLRLYVRWPTTQRPRKSHWSSIIWTNQLWLVKHMLLNRHHSVTMSRQSWSPTYRHLQFTTQHRLTSLYQAHLISILLDSTLWLCALRSKCQQMALCRHLTRCLRNMISPFASIHVKLPAILALWWWHR